MQGPNAPWCVGSVFFPPQLLTKDLGPLVFNPLGDPQRLLSIAQRLQQLETAISTSKRIESFIQGSASSFVPRDLLQDHLHTDSSINDNSQFYGNLLQGLKCNDGSVVVFFICGEGTDRIASTVCRCGSNRKWSSIPTSLSSRCLDDSEQTGLSVSPSLQHSIRQLSAVWADFLEKGGTRLAIVAARTYYHVFFCIMSVEEDRLQFITTAVSKFQVATAHVAWSPHDCERAAVILESGTLCIFQIKASELSKSNGVVELIPTAILECSTHRCFTKLSVKGNQVKEHGHDEQNFGNNLQGVAGDSTENRLDLERKWWCCEFGWFPHTVLVANSQEIFLVDLTEKNCHSKPGSFKTTEVDVSMPLMDLMVNVGACEYSRFCSLQTGKEIIVALGRDPNSGMYEFCVATERHVILFDARQPQTPILQWEHGMRQDLPSLLIMCPLSALRSLNDEDKVKDFQSGRIIIAASFKSGDMRVFCYGSDVSRVELPPGNSPKKQKLEGHDWCTAAYAWDIPSTLYAPLADVDDCRDVVSSSQGLFSKHGHQFVPKLHRGGQNVAGMVLLSENSPERTWKRGQKTFAILQLTGQGELLAQTYEASHELQDPSKARISSIDDKSDAEDSIGAHRPKHHEVNFEVLPTLPTFLRYIHTGSILNQPFNRSGKEQVGLVVDKAEGRPNSGQYERNGGAFSKWTKQDLPVLDPNFEKTVRKTEMETQLKVLVRDLNVPLNMHEVARKVLGMGLPERLLNSDSGLASDLNAPWNRGYNFPCVSSLLASTVPSLKFAELTGEGEAANDILSNDLTRKTSFQETIPLPLLLEIQSIENPNAATSSAHVGECWTNPLESGHIVDSKNSTDTKSCSERKHRISSDRFAGSFADGHKILSDGSRYIGDLVEQLVSKNEHTVISLSEPGQNWQANPESDGQSDSQILLFSKREKEIVSNSFRREDSDPVGSLMAADKTNVISDTGKSTDGVLHDRKENCGTFVEDSYSEFVARKASSENQESSEAKHYLEIDRTLCPIKLCFTDPDEELEQVELAALEDLRANFLQWQQSFPPYRTLQ